MEDAFWAEAPQLLSGCRSGFDVLLQSQILHEETQTTSRGLEVASLFPDVHLSGIPQLNPSSAFWCFFFH